VRIRGGQCGTYRGHKFIEDSREGEHERTQRRNRVRTSQRRRISRCVGKLRACGGPLVAGLELRRRQQSSIYACDTTPGRLTGSSPLSLLALGRTRDEDSGSAGRGRGR
jgi:hypothetical protein